MNKNICITVIGFLIIFKIQAQDVFDKKGMWGLSSGTRILIPRVNEHFDGNQYVTPKLSLGIFHRLERNFVIKIINNRNFLYFETGFEYSKNNYKTKQYITKQNNFGILFKAKNYIKIEKKGIWFYSLGGKWNYINPNFLRKHTNARKITDVDDVNFYFEAGYCISVNEALISFYFQFEFFSKEISNHIIYHPKISKSYNNTYVGVVFNF